jgi:hypothetical protein
MNGPYNNGWNRSVIALLAREFERRREQQNSFVRIPERPAKYVKDMFEERFLRCRRCWKEARPNADEAPEDVEKRVRERRDAELTIQRRCTRRNAVSAA